MSAWVPPNSSPSAGPASRVAASARSNSKLKNPSPARSDAGSLSPRWVGPLPSFSGVPPPRSRGFVMSDGTLDARAASPEVGGVVEAVLDVAGVEIRRRVGLLDPRGAARARAAPDVGALRDVDGVRRQVGPAVGSQAAQHRRHQARRAQRAGRDDLDVVRGDARRQQARIHELKDTLGADLAHRADHRGAPLRRVEEHALGARVAAAPALGRLRVREAGTLDRREQVLDPPVGRVVRGAHGVRDELDLGARGALRGETVRGAREAGDRRLEAQLTGARVDAEAAGERAHRDRHRAVAGVQDRTADHLEASTRRRDHHRARSAR